MTRLSSPVPSVLGYVAGFLSCYVFAWICGVDLAPANAILWLGGKWIMIVLGVVMLGVVALAGWGIAKGYSRHASENMKRATLALFALVAIAVLVITIPMPKFAEEPPVYTISVNKDCKPGCVSCDEQKAERPDIITGKPSGNDNPSWLSRWWGSWQVRDLLHVLSWWQSIWEKDDYERRMGVPASAPSPRVTVEQIAIAQQVAADSQEMERQRRLEEVQAFLLSELADLIRQGAKDGEGCVAFTRQIARSQPGQALGLDSLSFRECLDLATTANVPMPQFNYPDGKIVIEAPTLARGRELGYSMDYSVQAGWHIVWTGKFRDKK